MAWKKIYLMSDYEKLEIILVELQEALKNTAFPEETGLEIAIQFTYDLKENHYKNEKGKTHD